MGNQTSSGLATLMHCDSNSCGTSAVFERMVRAVKNGRVAASSDWQRYAAVANLSCSYASGLPAASRVALCQKKNIHIKNA